MARSRGGSTRTTFARGRRPSNVTARRRFRKTARAFARLGRKVNLILTSPLVRAVQTAEILAAEARHGEVAVLEELDPKFGARSLLEAVAKRADGVQSIALVGHDPQLSSALATLAGLAAELSAWFKDILATGPPTEQFLARSVLRKLGDASQEAALLGFRTIKDHDLRRL